MTVKLSFLLAIFGCSSVLSYRLLQYPGDCTKYQECDPSIGGCYVRDCGPGTEFNPNTANCDWPIPDRTDCENRYNQADAGHYQGGHQLLEYPGDCTKYQDCDKSLDGCYVRVCGPGTEFNPKISTCDYPIIGRVGCKNRSH